MTELLLLTYGKFVLASLMLLAFFFAVLRGRASYRMQRLYLIAIPFASLAMSGFSVEVYKPEPHVIEMTRTEIQQHHAKNAQSGYHYEAEEGGSLEGLDINPFNDLTSVMVQTAKEVHYSQLVLVALFCVSAILLLIAAYNIIKMCMFSRRMKGELTEDGLRLVCSPSIKSAFSFGKTIFLPANFDKEKTTYILTHEKAHIALKHYVDVWVIEFMVRLLWFNPFLWIVRKQLRNVHEYEADRCVVNSGADILRYQTFLLEEVTESSLVMANGFSHSFIRQRFIEMKKSSVGRLGIAGKTATVLWAIVLFCAFTFTVGKAETIIKYKAQNGRTEQKAIAENERLEEEELEVIEEEDTDQDWFREDYFEISGKVSLTNGVDGKRIYCQFPYFHRSLNSLHSEVESDGSFSLKIKIGYPGFVSLIIYQEGEHFTRGKIVADNIFVRPGERMKVSINQVGEKYGVDVESDKAQVFSHFQQYAPIFVGRRAEIFYMGDDVEYKLAKLQELNDSVEQIAKKVIKEYDYSDTEAQLYLNKLKAAHYEWCVLTLRNSGIDDSLVDEQIFSLMKQLPPNDEIIFINSVLCLLTGLFPHELDSVRAQVYRSNESLPVTEKERKVQNAVNEVINRHTGWTGLTYISQAAYVSGMMSAPFQHLSNRDCAEIVSTLTHPYLQAAAKEMILYKKRQTNNN